MFPLTGPMSEPRGTLFALLGVRLARIRDLVGIHQEERQGTLLRQSCWELGMSSSAELFISEHRFFAWKQNIMCLGDFTIC